MPRWFAHFWLAVALGPVALAQSYSISTLVPASPRAPLPRFEGAGGIAADDAGNVYFADQYQQTIGKVSPSGQVTTIAGTAGKTGYVDGPALVAQFNLPSAVALDSGGNLYIAESGNQDIRKLSPAGVVTTLAGGGQSGGSGSSQFSNIQGMAVGPDRVLYVSQWSNGPLILKVTPDGTVTTFVTSSTAGMATPFEADGIAVDRAGNLYVADRLGQTVRKVTPDGTMTILAGTVNVPGSADGVGTAAQFYEPQIVAVDATGNLFVADGNDTLRKITPDGRVTTIAGQQFVNIVKDGIGGGATFGAVVALAIDGTGNIFLNEYGGVDLRKATATSSPSVPVITKQPAHSPYDPLYVGEPSAVTFAVAAASDLPVSYQWLKSGVPIPGAVGPAYSISAATVADAGSYAVDVSNSAGTVRSLAKTLFVFQSGYGPFTTRHVATGGSFLWAIAAGPGQLVAVGTGGKILTSTDGVTWVTQNSGTSEWLVGATFGGGKYVVVGDHGTILTSTNAVTWTPAKTPGTSQRLNNVAYGNGTYVAVGEAGTIVTSIDASTWNPQPTNVTGWLRGLVFVPFVDLGPTVFGDNGTNRFYASGQNGVLLEQTTHGWVQAPDWPGQSRPDIEALADGPVGIGQDGVALSEIAPVMYAKGGTWSNGHLVPVGSVNHYWLSANIGLTARFRGLATAAGSIFATGENGVVAAAPSINGPWTFVDSGTTANLVGGIFQGNTLYVVGENETILASQPLYTSRLVNISSRAEVGTGAATMTSGFVVTGTQAKSVLIRAAGPSLAGFKVQNPVAATVLTLFDGNQRPIAANTGWSTASNSAAIATAAGACGAFPFSAGGGDSALLLTLPPGSYTAQVTSADGSGGIALAEVYDAEPATVGMSRAINISTRAQVGTGDNVLVAGFSVNGTAARRVLIRGIGPSLSQFGLDGLLAEPQLELRDRYNTVIRQAGSWSQSIDADAIKSAGDLAHAFSLLDGSNDAAMVITLQPGNYTALLTGANGGTGLGMVEVYDLP